MNFGSLYFHTWPYLYKLGFLYFHILPCLCELWFILFSYMPCVHELKWLLLMPCFLFNLVVFFNTVCILKIFYISGIYYKKE
jgi:hypothetical protein